MDFTPDAFTPDAFTPDDAVALYDEMYRWDGANVPSDRFFDLLVHDADSVLDIGCGTGMMLHQARDAGHTGRLVGLDPDLPSLRRARRRTDIEWVEGVAVDSARWQDEFALATMASNAFQCLVTDEDLRASLAAIHGALRPGGRFAFETRNPAARAWEGWIPSAVQTIAGGGWDLRQWHEVESVIDDTVTFTETTARPDGTVLDVGRTTLRFLGETELDTFLTHAGFAVELRQGDWEGGPVTDTSRSIVTVAVKR
ncbi:class I SAM-dependent methyltransferase [Streptacidiphilus jiangxiensis]|uniref:Methyltransferase domain-containing protein n=1 Tax=Streptacidiphilus jiangxiensis TaxID=235985 RepID=A0A1H7W1K2_STRJI|nr:class I SAM-dependent methyltransferase [Streptacidiphilus jiangxiensis]SEM14898.1 Methyltransferase domain-containing protein [Streptacidiphilus jiangxiensis]